MKKIPYGRQHIDKRDVQEVRKSLFNDLITTGPYVKKLEQEIKKKFQVKYSLSTSSGTSAIHLALLSINLKPGDIIIVPIINFIAAINLSTFHKAKIYYTDVDPISGQMTPKNLLDCIKKNKIKKIKAFFTMYLGGNPINILEFYKIKKKYKCYLIEDACHALGSKYFFKDDYSYVGSCKHSDICTFSMHPIKTITSGEGGLLTTNNKNIYEKARIMRNHGILKNDNRNHISKKHWVYDIKYLGFNYRLSDINCALAYSQLKKLSLFINKRKKIAKNYINLFKKEKFIRTTKIEKYTISSWHLFLVSVNFKKINSNKDALLSFLLSKGIIAQQHYIPIYKFTYFKKTIKGKFKFAEIYHKNTISLPIHYGCNANLVNYIYKQIIKFIQIKLKSKK